MKRSHMIVICSLAAACVLYTLIYSLYHSSYVEISSLESGIPTVVIDAGHGGEDGGAVSVSGVTESEINLSIAKRTEQLLAFCGIKVCMTRNDEQAIHTEGNTIRERKISDLKQRVRIANSFEPAILISIHQNHYPDSQYSGAQVFYAGTNGSKEFAQNMQTVFWNALNGAEHREIKRAESAYLMKNIRCTGILVECGFLSNEQEDYLLRSDVYQKKISCAITCATAQYLEKGSGEVEI